jgi:hypothetical protein
MYIVILIIQVLCIVHSVKTGRTQPWLYVLMFIPIVGVIAYVIFEILPDPSAYPFGQQIHEFLHKSTQKKVSVKTLEEMAQDKPTVQNLVDLADAYMNQKKYAEAAPLYQKAIDQSIADDGEIRKKLAFAYFERQAFSDARRELEKVYAIRQNKFKSDELLYYARTVDAIGDIESATKHFQKVIESYPSLDGDYYYCLFLQKMSRHSEIPQVIKEAKKKYKEMSRRFRGDSSPWLKKLEKEFS